MTAPLSERIVRDNRAVFEEMLDHRFVADIRAGTLPAAVFDRYLAFECAFVGTAISIFAYLTAKAPTLADQRRLVGVLKALTDDQMIYFERAFARRGLDGSAVDPDHADVRAFRDGMLEIARDGSYLEGITAMFGAEWMYWTWCRDVAGGPIGDALVREWVELHTEADFRDQAHWLKAQIDAAEPGLSEEQIARLGEVFGRVQRLEIAFHEAAYAD